MASGADNAILYMLFRNPCQLEHKETGEKTEQKSNVIDFILS